MIENIVIFFRLIHPHKLADGTLDQNSVPAFGFRNILPLDLNTSKFEVCVKMLLETCMHISKSECESRVA